jgi:signal transduction histidine kinase/ligand-binding sensor domain-containing protein
MARCKTSAGFVAACCLLAGLVPIRAARAAPISISEATISTPYDLDELRHTAFHAEGLDYILSIAQTADGFLWLATPTGLFRYDGARFDTDLSNKLPSPSVRALLADPDGSLWIGYTFGGVSVVRNGRVFSVNGGRLPLGSVLQFFRSSDGTLWAATPAGLARLRGDEWQTLDDHEGYSGERPYWMGAKGGQLVVVTQSAAFSYSAATGRFERRPLVEGDFARYGIPEGSAWRPDLQDTDPSDPGQTMVDRTGALWVSGNDILWRYRWSADRNAPARKDQFAVTGGLTGSALSMLEDREGNIWVGTTRGLDRFSIPRAHKLFVPDGLTKPFLIPGEHGDVWVGGWKSPFVRIDDHQRIPGLDGGASAAFRAPDGTLWLAGGATVFQYKSGEVLTSLPAPVSPGSEDSRFQAIAVSADGTVWVSVVREDLFRWDHGAWSRADQHYRLPRGPAVRLLVDAHRRLWIAYPDNQLAVVEGDHSKVFTAADGLNVGNVLALDVEESHTWLVGDRGLGVLVGTRFIPVRGTGDVEFRPASGVVETPSGDLWLNGAKGVYHIPAASVRSVLAGTSRAVEFEVLSSIDGLTGGAEMLRPGPTMLETPDGRLWFTRVESAWSIDPAHLFHNPVAPVLSIQDLICNGTHYEAGTEMNLPSGSRNLQIDYTAAMLTNPERVRFRYRLVGVDEGWQDVGQRRQAYYTNLGPGSYKFEVVAANEDGVWSKQAGVLGFKIKPAFYQTLGFKIAAAVAAMLLLALLFFVRLEQIHRRYRREVEARHAERERIARDLHDTLLQGVQALLFRLRMWEEDGEIPESRRVEIAAVSHQTTAMVLEGRERILMMRRTDAQPVDLVESLTVIGNEASAGKVPAFEVKVAGDPRTLTAHATEQLLDIAREAVRNAYKHAGANRIAVTLEYRKRALAMCIADDGRGFDPARAEGQPQSRHFGLTGMRERARQLGAQFRVQSDARTGTRIEVIVPAWSAFRDVFRWPWQNRARGMASLQTTEH